MNTFINIFLTASTWFGSVYMAWLLILLAGFMIMCILIFVSEGCQFLMKLWLKFDRWVESG